MLINIVDSYNIYKSIYEQEVAFKPSLFKSFTDIGILKYVGTPAITLQCHEFLIYGCKLCGYLKKYIFFCCEKFRDYPVLKKAKKTGQVNNSGINWRRLQTDCICASCTQSSFLCISQLFSVHLILMNISYLLRCSNHSGMFNLLYDYVLYSTFHAFRFRNVYSYCDWVRYCREICLECLM